MCESKIKACEYAKKLRDNNSITQEQFDIICEAFECGYNSAEEKISNSSESANVYFIKNK